MVGRSVAFREDATVFADWGSFRGSDPMGRRLITSLSSFPHEYLSFDETDAWQRINPFENVVMARNATETDELVSYMYGAGNLLVTGNLPLRMGEWGAVRARVTPPDRCGHLVTNGIADPLRANHLFVVCDTDQVSSTSIRTAASSPSSGVRATGSTEGCRSDQSMRSENKRRATSS